MDKDKDKDFVATEQEESSELLDCVITLDNGVKVVVHLNEDNYKDAILEYHNGTQVKFEELSVMGVYSFQHLKFIIDTKHPDVVTQVRIEKSKVGEKDTI